MCKFNVWVRLNQFQTANIIIHANHGYEAKMIAESQYGSGNVLNYTQVND
jgi:hypothetical protein